MFSLWMFIVKIKNWFCINSACFECISHVKHYKHELFNSPIYGFAGEEVKSESSGIPTGLSFGIVIAVLVVLAAAIGLITWKVRKSSEYRTKY